MNIKKQLLNLGMKESQIDNHCSDLYVLKNNISTTFIKSYEYKQNVTTFVSDIDGLTWYEIPFSYYPFNIESNDFIGVKFEGTTKAFTRDILRSLKNQLAYREIDILEDLHTVKRNHEVPNGYYILEFYDSKGNGFEGGKTPNGYSITC